LYFLTGAGSNMVVGSHEKIGLISLHGKIDNQFIVRKK